jgi:hypothetical protein
VILDDAGLGTKVETCVGRLGPEQRGLPETAVDATPADFGRPLRTAPPNRIGNSWLPFGSTEGPSRLLLIAANP